MSAREFLDTYEQQKNITIDIGGYIRNLFSSYPLESTIVVASIISFVYLVASGMTIVGIGQLILVLLGMYVYTNLTQGPGTKWPPTFSPCPNGYYQDTSSPSNTTIVCRKLTNKSVIFSYTGTIKEAGCNEARRKGIDWDLC
jgi:hypothetical protein